MESVFSYFAQDPLRILYVVGGSGGVWFWISLWRGRIRVVVRRISHKIESDSNRDLRVELRFEIENLGDLPTSLEPEITVYGYDQHAKQWRETLTLETSARTLEPSTPIGFLATGDVGADYVFWLFKRYEFRLTKGSTKVIRFRTQPQNDRLSPFRYLCEVTLFRLFRILPFVR